MNEEEKKGLEGSVIAHGILEIQNAHPLASRMDTKLPYKVASFK